MTIYHDTTYNWTDSKATNFLVNPSTLLPLTRCFIYTMSPKTKHLELSSHLNHLHYNRTVQYVTAHNKNEPKPAKLLVKKSR